MKRWSVFLTVVCLTALGLWFRARQQARTNPSTPSPASKMAPPLGVEQFMKNADSYSGVVTVEGVVASMSKNAGLFSMIDFKEFRECGLTDCARWVLPVRWKGSVPALKTVVRVEGRATRLNGKRVFDATSVTPSDGSSS